MRLDPEVVTWISAHMFSGADDRELERTYDFPHPLNARRELVGAWVDSSTPAESRINWMLFVFEPGGACISRVYEGRVLPFARAAAPNAGFFGSARFGRVAWNELLMLDERYRGQKFARAIYAAEETLYSRWGIEEIQLTAVQDGITVWPRLGFLPQEPEVVRLSYKFWMQEQNIPGVPPEEFGRYDPKFFATLRELSLYKPLSKSPPTPKPGV